MSFRPKEHTFYRKAEKKRHKFEARPSSYLPICGLVPLAQTYLGALTPADDRVFRFAMVEAASAAAPPKRGMESSLSRLCAWRVRVGWEELLHRGG